MQDLEALVTKASSEFAGTSDAAELERIKALYLGKSGLVSEALKGLGKLPPEERKAAGARINAVKDRIEAELVARRAAIASAAM